MARSDILLERRCGEVGGVSLQRGMTNISGGAAVMIRRRKWTIALGLLAFFAPGTPAIFHGGFGGVVNYPRYIPAIIKARYTILKDGIEQPADCKKRPDRCLEPVSAFEFYHLSKDSKFKPIANYTVIFRSRFIVDGYSPQSSEIYYYIDGHLCTSENRGIFPNLACRAFGKKGGVFLVLNC